jgi:hypothetical protein
MLSVAFYRNGIGGVTAMAKKKKKLPNPCGQI